MGSIPAESTENYVKMILTMESNDPNKLERKIEEILEVQKINSEKIDKIYKYQKWQIIYKTIYWIFIIGAALGAYYFLKPGIDSIKTEITNFKDIFNTITCK